MNLLTGLNYRLALLLGLSSLLSFFVILYWFPRKMNCYHLSGVKKIEFISYENEKKTYWACSYGRGESHDYSINQKVNELVNVIQPFLFLANQKKGLKPIEIFMYESPFFKDQIYSDQIHFSIAKMVDADLLNINLISLLLIENGIGFQNLDSKKYLFYEFISQWFLYLINSAGASNLKIQKKKDYLNLKKNSLPMPYCIDSQRGFLGEKICLEYFYQGLTKKQKEILKSEAFLSSFNKLVYQLLSRLSLFEKYELITKLHYSSTIISVLEDAKYLWISYGDLDKEEKALVQSLLTFIKSDFLSSEAQKRFTY